MNEDNLEALRAAEDLAWEQFWVGGEGDTSPAQDIVTAAIEARVRAEERLRHSAETAALVDALRAVCVALHPHLAGPVQTAERVALMHAYTYAIQALDPHADRA
jgi:hypothetical protein